MKKYKITTTLIKKCGLEYYIFMYSITSFNLKNKPCQRVGVKIV